MKRILKNGMRTIVTNLHMPRDQITFDDAGEILFDKAADELIEKDMANFRKQGRLAAHSSYQSNLQIPEELEETLRPIFQQNILDHEEILRKSSLGNDGAIEYRNLMSSSLQNEKKASMRVGDVVSHNFSARGAEQVFEAHANLVKPSLLPEMAEESLTTSAAVIGSIKSAAPELMDSTLETGTAKLSRSGLRIFGSATKKTSTKIIERYGNCS